MNNAQRLGLVLVFAWFFFGGIAHLLFDGFFLRMIPSFIGAPDTVAAFFGVLEILGAIGVIVATFRQLAGWGLFLLTLLMTPASLHMWVHFDQYPEFSPALLGLRLLFQVLLLALILFSTQPLPLPRKAAA